MLAVNGQRSHFCTVSVHQSRGSARIAEREAPISFFIHLITLVSCAKPFLL